MITAHEALKMNDIPEQIYKYPESEFIVQTTRKDAVKYIRANEPTITLSKLKALAEGMKKPPIDYVMGQEGYLPKDQSHNAVLDQIVEAAEKECG